MDSMPHPHTLQTAMDDTWRNASTTSVEFYEYETLDGIAIIFRQRNGQYGYLACIAYAGHFLMADAHFLTIDAAKLWVAFHIVRLMLRHQPSPAPLDRELGHDRECGVNGAFYVH